MARPKFKKKKHSSGKVFPWTYDEKDFQYGKIVESLGTFVYGVTSHKGEDKHKTFAARYDEMYNLIDRQEDDGKPNEEDTEKIFACDAGTRFFSIGVADQDVAMQDTYRLYVGSGIRKKFFDFYRTCKAEIDEFVNDYRSRYAGRTDAKSKYLNQMANRYADFLYRFEELNNPDAGSKLKAEFDAPALNVLNGLWSGAPKIDARFTFEQCIDGLDPIFEDYMTMLDAGPRCSKVEFHRQQMEQSGWDEKKEKIYLKEMREEYVKTVTAFDRLWAVDDKKQYDPYLDNNLDHLVGKTSSNTRDANAAVGMMRGQIRAMDMGYDSRHLYILGIIGQQEQMLKKLESNHKIDIANERADEAKKASLRGKLEQIRKYRDDFDKFRDSLWNRHVFSKQDMEAAETAVIDFFDSHNEEFKEIQEAVENQYKRRLDYNKEEAAEFNLPEKKTPRLNIDNVKVCEGFVDVVRHLNDNDVLQDIQTKNYELYPNIGDHTFTEKQGSGVVVIDDGYDKAYKDYAKDVLKKFDEYVNTHVKDENHPKSEALRFGFVEFAKINAETVAAGYPINTDPAGKDYAFATLYSLMPQLKKRMFDPEYADRIEAGLNEFPIHELAKKACELQKITMDLFNGKDMMAAAEKDEYYRIIREKRVEFFELVTDLKEKATRPTDNIYGLFDRKNYLTDETQFIGERGLEGLQTHYRKEFAKTRIPAVTEEKFASAFKHFNGHEGIVLINRESETHARIRESIEQLKERLEVLKKGVTQGDDGSERPFTGEEKLELLYDTQNMVLDVSNMMDDYVAEGEGKDKLRLLGAREFKDAFEDLQEAVIKEQEFTTGLMKRYLEREAAKNNIENDNIENDDIITEPVRIGMNFDELEREENPEFEKDKINEPVKAVNTIQKNMESGKESFKGKGLE